MSVVNIIGYDGWYKEKPWCRYETDLKNFDVTYNENNTDITYFIKDGIFKINDGYSSNINVALLTECRTYDNRRHDFLEKNHNHFDYIVTYDDKLIEMFKEKVIVTPYGGTWIQPKEQQKVYDKNKLCSYITSIKTDTENQKMRVRLLAYFNVADVDIELFGRSHNPLPENHEDTYDGKIIGLKDFAFSLAIENHIQTNYFSEKIMDCFMTGTIPIYCGASKLGNYFNMDGVITFDTEDEVKKIINELTMDKYNEKINAVNENYKLAKQFIDSLSYSYNLINARRKNDT
jgi:hypothetical protein